MDFTKTEPGGKIQLAKTPSGWYQINKKQNSPPKQHHASGSKCGEAGIRPHLHLVVKLKYSDYRYGEFKKLRQTFINRLMKADTRAIGDLN